MRVAVVGSGVSGLAATWFLNEHTEHEVHLYEADARPGGHANTVNAAQPGKEPVDVDTGFIVFNPTTYPNFLRFLRQHPSIEILKTEMTFSVSRDAGAFEWAGDGLGAVFCQPWRALDPRMWRMIYDILRFNACAPALLAEPEEVGKELGIGVYLEKQGYSEGFRDDYLLPMTAAVWSTPPDVCALDIPARTLIRFMHNHHLLQITGKPSWLTIAGGSKQYVNAILANLPPAHLHLSTPVLSVRSPRSPNSSSTASAKVILKTVGGESEYDHVIFACHSDQILKIIEDATDEEKTILGGFGWSQNEVVLHSDVNFLPKAKSAWSCWNYLTLSGVDKNGVRHPNSDQVSLTYYMNALQHLPASKHGLLLATLNPLTPPAPSQILARFTYAHPVLSARAVRMQTELPAIQGVRGLSYVGAWTRYGFHEDGWASGLRAAVALGSERPEAQEFGLLDAERGGEDVGLLAVLFGVFEGSGARAVVGAVLGRMMVVVAFWVLGVEKEKVA